MKAETRIFVSRNASRGRVAIIVVWRAKFIENKPFSPNSSYSGGNVRNGRDRAQLRSCSCGLSSAGDDLDSVSGNKLSAILHLESNVLQLKRPDFIAETVGIEAALQNSRSRYESVFGLQLPDKRTTRP